MSHNCLGVGPQVPPMSLLTLLSHLLTWSTMVRDLLEYSFYFLRPDVLS